jgi:hypothetical protein
MAPPDCDDQNECTIDILVNDTCFHVQIPLPEVNDTECLVPYCVPATGEIIYVPRNCSDGSKCTTEECINGTGCVYYYPEFAPPESGQSEECMNFSCIVPATGYYEWFPLPIDSPCKVDDPCHRFACDGVGYCRVRPDKSWRCYSGLFSSTGFILGFSFLLFGVVLGIGILLAIVIFVGRSSVKSKPSL